MKPSRSLRKSEEYICCEGRNYESMSCKEGFLQKQGKRKVQGYKKRWFVLSGTVVKYYSSQETSESNVLGVIDMARVVSVKQSKHVKNGFEVTTLTRSYYLSSKTAEQREEWMQAIQRAVERARKLSTASSAYSSDGNQDHVYQFANSQSRPSVSSLSTPTYAVITGSSNSSSEYAVVGGPGSQVSGIDSSSATYSLVGGPVHPTYPAISYDEVPNRKPEGDSYVSEKEVENIYDDLGGTSPLSSKRIPLNDTSGDSASEGEILCESGDRSVPNMSSLMSKLSMESLDSIDSAEATDDENYDCEIDGDVYDGDAHSCDSHVHSDGDKVLPQPSDGQKYATEKIEEFLNAQGVKPSKNVNYRKIDDDFNLNLDSKPDFPAFDALKKFLIQCE